MRAILATLGVAASLATAVSAAMPTPSWAATWTIRPPVAPATPPAAPEATAPIFYFDDGGKPSAPLSLQELEAKIASGVIKPDTLVWKSGTPSWIPARQLAEIAPFFASSDDELTTLLVGEWDASQPGGKQPTAATLIVKADGTMTGDITVPDADPMPMTGTWVARKINDKHFDWTITMVIDVPDQTQPQVATDSTHLEIVDHDTLRDVDDGTVIKRVGPH